MTSFRRRIRGLKIPRNWRKDLWPIPIPKVLTMMENFPLFTERYSPKDTGWMWWVVPVSLIHSQKETDIRLLVFPKVRTIRLHSPTVIRRTARPLTATPSRGRWACISTEVMPTIANTWWMWPGVWTVLPCSGATIVIWTPGHSVWRGTCTTNLSLPIIPICFRCSKSGPLSVIRETKVLHPIKASRRTISTTASGTISSRPSTCTLWVTLIWNGRWLWTGISEWMWRYFRIGCPSHWIITTKIPIRYWHPSACLLLSV